MLSVSKINNSSSFSKICQLFNNIQTVGKIQFDKLRFVFLMIIIFYPFLHVWIYPHLPLLLSPHYNLDYSIVTYFIVGNFLVKFPASILSYITYVLTQLNRSQYSDFETILLIFYSPEFIYSFIFT